MARPSTHLPTSAHLLGGFARTGLLPLAATLVLGAVPAQAPEPAPVQRLVLTDAQRLLDHPAPEVRGEAAMLVASAGDTRAHLRLVELTKDPAAEARLRAILALGLLGAPGSEHVLGEFLDDTVTRPTPEGTAAALALGLLADGHEAPAIARYLSRFLRSSYRRQRDVLIAMLVGFSTKDHPGRTAALHYMLDDAANRDPELRAAIITALGATKGGVSGELAIHLLEHGSEAERAATLRAVLPFATEPVAEFMSRMVQVQERDPSGEVRALALAWLTAARHLPAIESAAKAMRSSHPAEARQGVRTALALAAGAMRRAIEAHIQGEQRPTLRAAMLQAFEPPWSAEFTTALLRTAADRRQPLELRTASALAAARTDDANTAPVLRDLFQETDDPDVLRELAQRLMTATPEPPDLERLCPGGRLTELARSPARISALLAAGHPEVARFALSQLAAESTKAADKAGLLRAFRCAFYPVLSSAQVARLPADLAGMFR